jgi:hypothetical protein
MIGAGLTRIAVGTWPEMTGVDMEEMPDVSTGSSQRSDASPRRPWTTPTLTRLELDATHHKIPSGGENGLNSLMYGPS